MHKKRAYSILFVGVIASLGLFVIHDYRQDSANGVNPNDYSLAAIISETPTTLSNSPDFTAIDSVAEKKKLFFEYLKKGVQLENTRVLKERTRLENLEKHFNDQNLSAEDNSYAIRLGKLYNVAVPAAGVDAKWFTVMNDRVDVLPYALVLIQAANESAWGTSRFATQGNNYFGQWCYTQGCGLVPKSRPDGSTYEVAKYDSVQQSIHAYFMNVNRNNAYQSLRHIRAELRQQNKSMLDDDAALALTNGLIKYSQRGQAYVDDLQTMIKRNEKYWVQ